MTGAVLAAVAEGVASIHEGETLGAVLEGIREGGDVVAVVTVPELVRAAVGTVLGISGRFANTCINGNALMIRCCCPGLRSHLKIPVR